MSGGYLARGVIVRGYLSGGICPGVYVRFFVVLEPWSI